MSTRGWNTITDVADMRDFNVTPHVAQNATQSPLGYRPSHHPKISQQNRNRVEEPFGWGKNIGGLARPMLRGVKKLDFKFTLTMAAYDLIKLHVVVASCTHATVPLSISLARGSSHRQAVRLDVRGLRIWPLLQQNLRLRVWLA
jgi:Transposase DDE domain